MGLQSRIDRFAFQGQDAEDAFVDAAQGFVADEAVEGFEAERELAQCQRAFGAEAALAESLQVLGPGVFRAVDDAQVLAATDLDGWLG